MIDIGSVIILDFFIVWIFLGPLFVFIHWMDDYNYDKTTFIQYLNKSNPNLNILGNIIVKIFQIPLYCYALIGLILYYILYIIEKLIKILFYKK